MRVLFNFFIGTCRVESRMLFCQIDNVFKHCICIRIHIGHLISIRSLRNLTLFNTFIDVSSIGKHTLVRVEVYTTYFDII